jgi:hypothetical protein
MSGFTVRRFLPRRLGPSNARRLGATLVAASLAVAVCSAPSTAGTTTVTPNEGGSPLLVRESVITLSLDQGGLSYFRSGTASSNFSAQSPLTASCKGDLGAIGTAGTGNFSPRDQIKVTGPGGAVVGTFLSPARDASVGGAFAGYPPLNPQPAPGASNYRGGKTSGSGRGFTATLDLSGKPAGVYTVTTTTQNMVKVGTGACTIGTPNADLKTFTAGVVPTTTTFEYRPWKYKFNDVTGNGFVQANTVPAEFQYKLGTTASGIISGADHVMDFYTMPNKTFLLPSNPEACASNPVACLPSSSIQCVPSTGCVPRIMVISKAATLLDPREFHGFFDLETKAFVVVARIGGTKRTLVSAGTNQDLVYGKVFQALNAAAAARGIDLAALMATTVVYTNGGQQLQFSLLNALQMDASGAPAGIQIKTPGTVQAGIILDIYSSLRLDGPACTGGSASNTSPSPRFTRTADNGYIVKKTDLVPSVPAVGPVAALVGGPVFHIEGKFNGLASVLVNTAAAVIGADTAYGEPTGYPLWVEPFLSPTHVAAPKTMDFLGTATWQASETPLGSSGCFVLDFMLGAGVAIYDNPTPVGFGDLLNPLYNPYPGIAANVMTAVNTAVQNTVDDAASNPTVDSVLTQILALLPPVV